MPCDDITEVLRLDFDARERLVHYTLTKRTCGAEIGRAALLLELASGLTAEELRALAPERVLERYPMHEAEEFLYWKHLAALQEASSVLTGQATPSACTPSQVTYDAEGRLHFEALVAVHALTERIEACGNCKRCRPKR